MNEYLRYILLSAGVLFGLILIIRLLEKLADSFDFFKKTITNIVKYFYISILIIGVLYFVLYDYYFSKSTSIPVIYTSLYEVSKILLSVGAFTGAVKYISTLKVFKDQIRELILSNDFKDVIGKKLEVFAYSPEMIDKVSDEQRNKLWKDVTLSKYRNNFPSIYKKLEYNIENELFIKANTNFYYKHFYVNYNIELDIENKDFVNITYKTIYTIVRNSTDKFNWSFSTKLDKEDFENGFSDIKVVIEDEKENLIFEKEKLKTEPKGDSVLIKIDHILNGKTEYHIEKINTFRQNLNKDRVLAFGSSRIIDDLIINVKYCKNLDIFFSRSNKNVYKSLDIKENEFSYENRKLLLPGDKFKLFIIKRDKIN